MSTSNLNNSQLPSITGGGLVGRYIFVQLHFHWSSDLIKGGSEHTINHTHYPCELHLVHFNSKYANLTEAENYADGVAVLGIFMEVTSIIQINKKDNKFKWLIDLDFIRSLRRVIFQCAIS